MKLGHLAGMTAAAMLWLTGLPAQAQGSIHASVHTSVGSLAVLSITTASVAVISVHAGSTLVVETIRAVGNTVELVLRGSAHASRAVIVVPATAIATTSLAVGHAVSVKTEGTGYLLVANGKVFCFVPGSGDDTLIRSTRSQ
jgi:hypothetical protein